MGVRRTLTRTITQTKIHSAIIEIKGGEPTLKKLKPKIELGDLSMKQAQRIVVKDNKDAQVTELEKLTHRYSMPMEEFMKQAEKSELETK